MNYEEMSDFEINKKVLLRLGKELHHIQSKDNSHGAVNSRLLNNGCKVVNYCNNATDAWPIIVENFMDVDLPHPELGNVGTITIYNPRGTDWQVDFSEKDNALRAAMICFLKMKDDQQ